MNVPAQFAPYVPLAELLGVVVGLLYIVAALGARRRVRFFTYAQRTLVGEAFGANCVWRPVHWLPAAAAYYVLERARQGATVQVGKLLVTSDNLYATGLGLVVVAGIGLPITRTSGRCGGTVQGGHQHANANGGTASIFNCSPECATHNLDKLTAGSWWWAVWQWPWTPLAYAPRHLFGTLRLGWMLLTSPKARRMAQQGTR